MMMDLQNLLSDDQNLAVAIGTHVSTNTIDLGTPGTDNMGNVVAYDVGKGEPLDMLIQVTETFTSAGAATVTAQIIESASADLSSPTVLSSSAAIALATLAAGYQFRLNSVPAGVSKRYLGVQYVVGTAATTAGKVTAGIVLDKQTTTV